jgi:hypothetical protein
MSEPTLPSPSQLPSPDPTTPAFDDDVEWFTAYLKIHALSHTTWRYAHFLWFAIGLVSVTFAAFHLLGLRSGVLGAYWSKWSLRRRTWRKKHSLAQAKKGGQPHKQPLLLPSNAQLLTLSALIIGSLAATFIGPDYIAPSRRLFHRAAPDVAAYIPQYTIQKAWWASGNRAGLIAFALFPLCILFALKRPPFAIFALPFFTNIHSDKLIWLHRWIGRFIWALVALHATLWSVQLFRDTRINTGDVAYVYAWHYQRFIFAWTVSIYFRIICNFEQLLRPSMLGVCSVHSSYFAIVGTYSRQVLRHILYSSHYSCPRYYHHVSATSPALVVVVLASPPAMGRRENMAGNKLAISKWFPG